MSSSSSRSVPLAVGTFPDPRPDAKPEGLWLTMLDLASGLLTEPQFLIRTDAPTFITQHPTQPLVMSIHENERGGMSVFDFSNLPTVHKLVTVPSGGVGPCHVSVDEHAARISHYGSGHVGVVHLSDRGLPDDTVKSLPPMTTFGPLPQQRASHAHYADTVADDVVWSADLGGDAVRAFSAASVNDWDTVAAQFPAGTGPRHFTVLDDGSVIVVGELNSHLYHLIPADDARTASITDLGLTHRNLESPEPFYPSHVEVSPDGKRLYVATRGVDLLSVFAINSGADRILGHIADVQLPEAWPRHFAVVSGEGHDVVIVAQERGHKLVSYLVNHSTGEVTLAAERDLPAPACVLPLREV